jgi:prepilin-type N-terminal cleavage/methylation domain-containing protein
MKKNIQAGFTLIELLVVIAIIGILASIVISSLTTARQKGADANIKSNLSNARAQGQVYYEENNSAYYIDAINNVCTSDTGVYKMFAGAATTASAEPIINGTQDVDTAHCNAYTDGWMIQVPLKQQNQVSATSGVDYYCVDSTGASKIQEQPATTFVEDTDVDPPTATPIACI